MKVYKWQDAICYVGCTEEEISDIINKTKDGEEETDDFERSGDGQRKVREVR